MSQRGYGRSQSGKPPSYCAVRPVYPYIALRHGLTTRYTNEVELDYPQGSSEAESPPTIGQPFEPGLGNAGAGTRFRRPRTVD